MINLGTLTARIGWGEKKKMKQKAIPGNGETMKVKFNDFPFEKERSKIIMLKAGEILTPKAREVATKTEVDCKEMLHSLADSLRVLNDKLSEVSINGKV